MPDELEPGRPEHSNSDARPDAPTDSSADAVDSKFRPTELSEADFQAAEVQPQQAATEVPSKQDIPGPGVLESLAWTIGVFPAQIFAGMAMTIVVLAFHMLRSGTPIPPQDFEDVMTAYLPIVTAGALFLFVLMTIIGVVLRLGPFQVVRRLSISPLSPLQTVAIAALVLPLSLLVGQIHLLISPVWTGITDRIEFLRFLDQMEQMQFIQPLAEALSLPALILVIAVSPAIGEELIFRGIIGRGLLARLGLVRGILLTSVLFAVMHIHPPVVVALIPLAIFIHLLYFTTRSFLAPVLLHFLNNSWAAVATKYADAFEVAGVSDELSVPPILLVSALACVTACGWWFWKSRAYYQSSSGEVWSPGYLTVERPPKEVEANRMFFPALASTTGLMLVGIAQFFALFFWLGSQAAGQG